MKKRTKIILCLLVFSIAGIHKNRSYLMGMSVEKKSAVERWYLESALEKNWQGFINRQFVMSDEWGEVVEIDWYKSQLDENQKRLYEEIEQNIDLNQIYGQQKFKKMNCRLDDVFIVFEALMGRYADLEFLIRNHSWAAGEDEDYFYFKVKESQPDKKLEDFKIIKNEVKQIVDSIDVNQSVREVVRDVHDLIIDRTDYDVHLVNENKFNAFGALIDGLAVCQGYSSSLKWIMDELDIPCIQVFGMAKGGRHAWNLVYFDHRWQGIDATWDDPINGKLRYDYFLNNELLLSDHFAEKSLFAFPKIE